MSIEATPGPSSAPAGSRERGSCIGTDAFLIPSVFGDEPQLCDLRQRLHEALRLDTLALPDAGARGTLLTDMVATGRLLADEIARRRPAGPVALVGYSFGASMALEVAAQLADAGRTVDFLAVLDGPFEPPAVAPRPADAVLAAPRRFLKSVAVDAVESLDAVRRLVAGTGDMDAVADRVDRAEPLRRAMLWHLRNKALKAWAPRPCAAPGLYVTSGEYGPVNRQRWAALCPNLHVVEVAAAHQHLLRGDALDAVSEALIAAVRRAWAGEASAAGAA